MLDVAHTHPIFLFTSPDHGRKGRRRAYLVQEKLHPLYGQLAGSPLINLYITYIVGLSWQATIADHIIGAAPEPRVVPDGPDPFPLRAGDIIHPVLRLVRGWFTRICSPCRASNFWEIKSTPTCHVYFQTCILKHTRYASKGVQVDQVTRSVCSGSVTDFCILFHHIIACSLI